MARAQAAEQIAEIMLAAIRENEAQAAQSSVSAAREPPGPRYAGRMTPA